MSKLTSTLSTQRPSRQKTSPVSRPLPLIIRLSSSVYFLVGSLLCLTIALLSPIYLYPGTMAATAASKTLTALYHSGVIPIEKSLSFVTHNIAERSENLFSTAPFSLNALLSVPKVNLPKITFPTPALASAAEPEVTQISTQLIAETIQDSIDPMISSPNNVLFPSTINLDPTLPPEIANAPIEEKEPEKVDPAPPAAIKPVVKTASAPKTPKQIVPAAQPVVMSGASRWPVVGVLSQTFSSYHPAIDIAAKSGTGVYPIQDGVVVGVTSLTYGLGKHVTIQHSGGLTSVYAHLSSMNVVVGQSVITSTVIGAVGTSGLTTGPHLHLATSQNGKPFNPLGRLLN